MNILILTTGGTIDKDYPHSQNGWAFEIGDPAIAGILKEWNPSFNYEIVSVFKKDSLEITDEDRKLLADKIVLSKSNQIVITHGTDTLIETGLFLQKHFRDKIIVLTGAMRPAKFRETDAYLNIGAAIGTVQSLSTGIYIVMHGICSPVDKIERDPESGRFIHKQ